MRDKVKYDKPKILLLDCQQDVKSNLKKEGYNICIGSLGFPYENINLFNIQRVEYNYEFPYDLSEQEIIIVDLLPKPPHKYNEFKRFFHTISNYSVNYNVNIINPIPLAIDRLNQYLSKIISFNGILILFSHEFHTCEYIINNGSYHSSNYGFNVISPLVRMIGYSSISGNEITCATNNNISETLSKYLENAEFACTFSCKKSDDDCTWIPLAYNKYNDVVSFLVRVRDKGFILVFPQIEDKGSFLIDLLKNVLPENNPAIFPYYEGNKWILKPEYEHFEIIEIQKQIEAINIDAQKRVVSLQQGIEEIRLEKQHIQDLVTETGEKLVISVEKSLNELGFKKVINMDEENRKNRVDEKLREDLQIRDYEPIILIEVKGISGIQKERDSIKVINYVAPRIKKEKICEIKGLSIVNHQRNIQAIDRNEAFQGDAILTAEENEIGLITTFDLYKIVRSFMQNKWTHENVKDIFYKNGKIEPAPTNYEYIGYVNTYWEEQKSLSIIIENNEIRINDRIAFDLPTIFIEQDLTSMQLDDKQVEGAMKGQEIGILTNLNKVEAKKGVRVFKVNK